MKRSEIRKRKQKSKRKKYGVIIGALIIIFCLINSVNDNENSKKSISHDSIEKKDKLFKKKIKKESRNVINNNKPKKKIIKRNISEKNKTNEKIKQQTKVKSKTAKKGKKKGVKKSDRIKSINAEIRKRLEQDRGFALGQLDENGHPTENGTPNFAFAWSVVVKRIEYSKNSDNTDGNVTVYVNSSFKNFSVSEKNRVSLMSQNIAGSVVGEKYNYSMEQYKKGLFTQIICEGNNIGRSGYFDYKEFKWNK